MRARDVMTQEVVTVRPDADVAEAVGLMTRHDVSALPASMPIATWSGS
jgi:CBS domain-containing protein